jgi:hypothetical protein
MQTPPDTSRSRHDSRKRDRPTLRVEASPCSPQLEHVADQEHEEAVPGQHAHKRERDQREADRNALYLAWIRRGGRHLNTVRSSVH